MVYPFESQEATKKYDDDKRALLSKTKRPSDNDNGYNEQGCHNSKLDAVGLHAHYRKELDDLTHFLNSADKGQDAVRFARNLISNNLK